MTRPVRTCSILSDPDNKRITLRLERQEHNGTIYVWIGPDGEDCGVCGRTIAEACDNAYHAWGTGDPWQIKARWLR
jgi:hypothetical protein